MRKTRAEKGITLIALIITIVILLILAVVTINSIKNDGIIDYAVNAKDDYSAKQDEEEATLQGFEDMLDSYSSSGGQSLTIAKLGVGDYVNYTPDGTQASISISGTRSGYWNKTTTLPYATDDELAAYSQTISRENTKWQVLKNDGKNIYLISEKPLTKVNMAGKQAWANGISILDEISNTLYGGSKAVKARSITIEDINEIFRPGFDADDETNWSYKDSTTGKEEYFDEGVRTIADAIATTKYGFDFDIRTYTDGSTAATNVNLTDVQKAYLVNYYMFDPGNTKNTISEEESNKYKANPAYNLVFNAFDSSSDKYWVASKCVHLSSNGTDQDPYKGNMSYTCDSTDFGLRYVKNGYSSQQYLGHGNDYMSGNGVAYWDVGSQSSLYYRPIVILKSDVEFEAATEKINNTNTWNIK